MHCTPRLFIIPQVFAAVEAPVFGRVSGQLAAAQEQARVAELKTGEAVQVGGALCLDMVTVAGEVGVVGARLPGGWLSAGVVIRSTPCGRRRRACGRG